MPSKKKSLTKKSAKTTKKTKVVKKAVSKKTTKKTAKKAKRKPGPHTLGEIKALSRKQKEINIARNKQNLRAKLQGVRYLDNVVKVEKEIDKILSGLDKNKDGVIWTGQEKYIKAKLNALDQKRKLNMDLLNKLLGDVKSVELSDPNGNNPLAALAEAYRQKAGKL